MMHYNPFGTSAETYLDWLKKLQQGLQQPAGSTNPFATSFNQMFNPPSGSSQANPWLAMGNWAQQLGAFTSPFTTGNATGQNGNLGDFWTNNPATQSWLQLQQALQSMSGQLQSYFHNAQVSPFTHAFTNPYQTQTNAFQPFYSVTKLQQLQYVIMQLCKLAASNDSNEEKKQQLSTLIRTLVEEINSMTVNPSAVQYINQIRSILEIQRVVLEEQLVQASLTPYKVEIERAINTCKLWHDCCEAMLAMFDIYQQFGEQFSETFAYECIEKIDHAHFDYNNPTQVFDFFVQSYERLFGELLKSENFGITYGQLTDSISAVRIDQQQYIDTFVEAFGLPSKREMDTTHKRANKHSQTLRRLEAKTDKLNQAQQQNAVLAEKIEHLGYQLTKQQAVINEQVNATSHLATLMQEIQELKSQLYKQQSIIDGQVNTTSRLATLTQEIQELKSQLHKQQSIIDGQVNATSRLATLTQEIQELKSQLHKQQIKTDNQPTAPVSIAATTVAKTQHKTSVKKNATPIQPAPDSEKAQLNSPTSTAPTSDTGTKQ